MTCPNELAKRAVACARWRWMPGMRASTPSDVPGGRAYGRIVLDANYIVRDHDPVLSVWYSATRHLWLPDLTDPGTLGALLSLVRDAWDWPHAFACHDEVAWYLSSGETGCCVELQTEAGDGERYDSEAEALVAALEAAP